ncbi:MAG TPA: cupredoxin domain-containing protein [Candidatus Limnocylindrales bacterium]|nr:cupredoxin domain-containing protein [Candidatus Limnocylindrales bacterium]
MIRRLTPLLAVVILVIAVLGCGGGSTSARDASPADTAAIVMKDTTFQPAHVAVPARTTVTWTNGDQVPHNVKFDDGPSSDNLAFGATFQRVFDDPGTFDYECTIHPGMIGRVTVNPR